MNYRKIEERLVNSIGGPDRFNVRVCKWPSDPDGIVTFDDRHNVVWDLVMSKSENDLAKIRAMLVPIVEERLEDLVTANIELRKRLIRRHLEHEILSVVIEKKPVITGFLVEFRFSIIEK